MSYFLTVSTKIVDAEIYINSPRSTSQCIHQVQEIFLGVTQGMIGPTEIKKNEVTK